MKAINYKQLIGLIAIDLNVSNLIVEAESNGFERAAKMIIDSLENRGLISIEGGEVLFGQSYSESTDDYQAANQRAEMDLEDDEFPEDPDETCSACGYNNGNHMKGCPEDNSPFAELCRNGYD